MKASDLTRISSLLNPIRMRYPYFIGAAMWLSWLISLALGAGNLDAAGHLVGTDFVAFYTAGRLVLTGQSADLYNLELARQIQQPLYPAPSDNFNPYLNPPFFAWLFVPFALLAYPWSPVAWMVANLVFLWISLRLLQVKKTWQHFFLILTWQPAFSAISFGQNAFLSLLILCLAYTLWRKDRLWTAGLIAGLLFYKPQLLFGVLFLCLLDLRRCWRVLAGCAIAIICLSGLSYALMPEATLQYVFYVQKIAANLMTVEGFPIWNAHAVQAFWLALFPNQTGLAQILHIACALLGVLLFILYWRVKRNDLPILFGTALCLTIWVTPYIMVYDWVLLVVPAVLFWQQFPDQQDYLKAIYAILWVTLFISSVLTFTQWTYFGRALQISVPVLAIVLLSLYKLTSSKQPEPEPLSAG